MKKLAYGKSKQTNIKIIESKKMLLEWSHDHENVVYSVRNMAQKVGFKENSVALIATAASELSTNILRYAKSGEITISIIEDELRALTGIRIQAMDHGPGIKDLELAMTESYTTFKGSLGLGLSSAKKLMDEFYIESELGLGTFVEIIKWTEK